LGLPPEFEPLPPELDKLSATELEQLSAAELAELEVLAKPVRDRERAPPEVMKQVVLDLCKGRYLGVRVLAGLLNRDANDLRKRVLNELVKERVLKRAYPRPNDPRQAYTTGISPNGDTNTAS